MGPGFCCRGGAVQLNQTNTDSGSTFITMKNMTIPAGCIFYAAFQCHLRPSRDTTKSAHDTLSTDKGIV